MVHPTRVSMPSDRGGTVEPQQHVLHLAAQHRRLNRGPIATLAGFTDCGLLAEEALHDLWIWESGRPAEKDDLVDLLGIEPGILERLLQSRRNGWVDKVVPTSCSNLARVRLRLRCLGPDWSAVMKGRLSRSWVLDKLHYWPSSTPPLRRWRAMAS